MNPRMRQELVTEISCNSAFAREVTEKAVELMDLLLDTCSPGDVFDDDELAQWAWDNGFTKAD